MATTHVSTSKYRFGVIHSFELSAANDDLLIHCGAFAPQAEIAVQELTDSQREIVLAVSRNGAGNRDMEVWQTWNPQPSIAAGDQWAPLEPVGFDSGQNRTRLNDANPTKFWRFDRPTAIWVRTDGAVRVRYADVTEVLFNLNP